MAAMFRMGDLFGLREEADRFAKFVLNNEEITTDKMVNYLSKRPVDLGGIYSKFMATCLVLWLAPDSVRKGGLRPSPETERSFDLLWLAYEQWMFRGMSHYMEVAGELNAFYGDLRWTMVQNRNSENAAEMLDTYSADAAHIYLTRVNNLAKKNFETFADQIGEVLEKLDGMKSRTNDDLAQTGRGDTLDEDRRDVPARTIRSDRHSLQPRNSSAPRTRPRKKAPK